MTETHDSWRRESSEDLGFLVPWGTLRPYRFRIVACAALLAIAALVLSLMSPKVWEAEATVLPGYVGQLAQPATLLEPVPRVVERLRARSFGDSALRKTGLPTSENDPQAKLFRDSLKVNQPLSTDVVRMSARARSSELAGRLLQEMTENLRSIHDALLAPSIARYRQDLAHTQADVAAARSEKERLEGLRLAEKGLAPANRFSESIHLGNLIAAKTAEIQGLEQRRLQLEEALSPAKSHSVVIIDNVRVNPRPVSPRPLRNTVLGGFVGLFLAIFGVLLWKGASSDAAQRTPEPGPRTAEDRAARQRLP